MIIIGEKINIEEVLEDHVSLAIDSSCPETIIAGIEQIKEGNR